ncbi:S-layer homology domain-containing protein [Paenibacillus sp. ACRRX]|uniref:S-layer homology domain-containing protein n=1 Tax=Paenibacillus sp. ACRRX TaxID=2918206 RepID=UPI001EF67654|nr:S-layer homology domain-containing protein [Paenibacillus sp. ACRRX]MCG7408675.1 S-layer homology domain-containing protein [Paenibacillus sp. ACRRX]
MSKKMLIIWLSCSLAFLQLLVPEKGYAQSLQFSPRDAVITSTNMGSSAISIGDITRSGKLDLVGGAYTKKVGIVLDVAGSPHQEVADASVPPEADPFYATALADLDGDGDLDFITAGPNGAISSPNNVYAWDETSSLPMKYTKMGSTYTMNQAVFYGMGVVTGDFNNDSKTDVMWFAGNKAYLGINNTTVANHISFSQIRDIGLDLGNTGNGNSKTKVGDFDGDGNLDFVGINSVKGGGYVVGYGNGTGQFRMVKADFSDQLYAIAVDVSDVNKDGRTDFILLRSRAYNEPVDNEIVLFTSTGASFDQQAITKSTDNKYNHIALSDLNNDTWADMIAYSGNDTSIYLNAGQGSFKGVPDSSLKTTSGATQLFIEDFNADGMKDIGFVLGGSLIARYQGIAGSLTAEASVAPAQPLTKSATNVQLRTKDVFGQVDTSYNGTKNVTISGVSAAPDGSYGSFNGTALDANAAGNGQVVPVNFANGQATVPLQLHHAATQQIQFSIEGVKTSLTNKVNITPLASKEKLLLQQDIAAPAEYGKPFDQQPVLHLTDGYGNVVTSDNSTRVTVSKQDSGDWKLVGTVTATARAGIVSFSGLLPDYVNDVTGAQLVFQSQGLTPVVSSALSLTGAIIPSVPTALTAIAGDHKAALTWRGVSEATAYKIYASTISGSYGTEIATVTGSVYNYELNNLINGTTYYFVVKAIAGKIESAASNEAMATPQVSAPNAPAYLTALAGNGKVTLNWGSVEQAAAYKIYHSTVQGAYGTEAATVTGNVYSYDVAPLINGTTYYFVVRAATAGGDGPASFEASAVPSTIPAAPTDVTAVAGDGQATVRWKAPIDDGGSPIVSYVLTAQPGNVVVNVKTTTAAVTNLTNGTAYTFTVRAINANGNGIASLPSPTVTPSTSTSSGGNWQGGISPTPADKNANIEVNGKKELGGTVEITEKDGQKTTAFTLDPIKLADLLSKSGPNTVITVPFADAAHGTTILSGNIVSQMKQQQTILEMKTTQGIFKLPLSQLDVNAIAAAFGDKVNPNGIQYKIQIQKATSEGAHAVELAAKNQKYKRIGDPTRFEVTASYGSQTISLNKHNGYVERMLALPKETDPAQVTTAVFLNKDGTLSHIPTVLTKVDGTVFVKMNNRVNGTFVVVWNPISFADMNQHWAQTEVNDLGSRLVVTGTADNRFEPKRDITRAEFAAIVVKGLGLMNGGTGQDSFKDVASTAWYYDAVSIASEYQLIQGYADGTFRSNDKISREEAIVILMRAMELMKPDMKMTDNEPQLHLKAFKDGVDVSKWAQESVAASIQNGVVKGNGERIGAKENMTRAEVAAVVRRMLQQLNFI